MSSGGLRGTTNVSQPYAVGVFNHYTNLKAQNYE